MTRNDATPAQSIDVLLGGKTYTIRRLTMRANREWREKLDAKLMQTANAVHGLSSDDMMSDISAMLQLLSEFVIRNVDAVIDLLFEYSPELAAHREEIEANAYDEEAFAALKEVIQMGLPLAAIFNLLPGSLGMPTTMNSALPNGASGTKRSTEGRRASTRRS